MTLRTGDVSGSPSTDGESLVCTPVRLPNKDGLSDPELCVISRIHFSSRLEPPCPQAKSVLHSFLL